jgi:hypothetical protein
MRKHIVVVAWVAAALTVVTAYAQPGTPPRPSFDAAMAKLFGDNNAFSATLEFHVPRPPGADMIMQGKFAFLDGKSRCEMDMSETQGSQTAPQVTAQMKRLGVARLIMITRGDKKLSYLVYPDSKAYVATATGETGGAAAEYKTEATKLGDETIDGHSCIKNKIVVTAPDGSAHESTVWNASDLNQFPIKIETTSGNGMDTVLVFKDVKLGKPDDAQFDVPADFKKYDNVMSLMMGRAREASRP